LPTVSVAVLPVQDLTAPAGLAQLLAIYPC